jgi:myosin heavy subunit
VFYRQVKQLGLVETARFRRFGYSYSSSYSEFYSRFRVCAHIFHPKFPASVSIVSTSKKEVENLGKQLLHVCLEQVLGVSTVSHTPVAALQAAAAGGDKHALVNATQRAINAGDLIFGSTRLFVREGLIDSLEHLRSIKQATLQKAAICVQACLRMFVHKKSYDRVCVGALAFQSICRMHTHRTAFNRQKRSANLVKAVFRMHQAFQHHQQLRKAVATLKTRLFDGMIMRVRFVCLQRSVRRFQSISRSYVIRRMSDRVLHAVNTLHAASRRFLVRLRIFYLRKRASSTIQRVFRGFVFRERNAAISYALKVRRNQRIVRTVIRKLQSKWRGILIRKRFQQVAAATSTTISISPLPLVFTIFSLLFAVIVL